MAEVGIEKDISLEFESMVYSDEPIPCAHSQHKENKNTHYGDASWLLELKCPKCEDNCRYPACNRFVTLGLAGILGIICTKCDNKSSFTSWLVSLDKL